MFFFKITQKYLFFLNFQKKIVFFKYVLNSQLVDGFKEMFGVSNFLHVFRNSSRFRNSSELQHFSCFHFSSFPKFFGISVLVLILGNFSVFQNLSKIVRVFETIIRYFRNYQTYFARVLKKCL